MITVSTSNRTVRSYHHGDLRSALVEAGVQALQGADAQDISLRQLARDVGVSATAVYRHFPDKQALLAALAAEGTVKLGQAQRLASEAVGDDSTRFAETGRAYVRFALSHPALFRLMFAHSKAMLDPFPTDSEASRMLHANASALAGSPENARRLEVQAWAVAHGLAMLMLDGHLKPDDTLIDAVIDSQTLFAVQGSNSEASP